MNNSNCSSNNREKNVVTIMRELAIESDGITTTTTTATSSTTNLVF
jgi:hypothetical protein